MVKFWARFLRSFIALVIVVPGVWGFASESPAAPIYDMHNLLGQTHPFLQPLPPLSEDPRNVPSVPVMRPSSQPSLQSGGQPSTGSGTMRLPRSFEQPARQPREASQIKWRQGPGASGAGQGMDRSKPGGKDDGFFSEIRIGALAHDQGIFSSNKENGYDANLELLFVSPDILDLIWSPRPHIGVTYNAYGDTSQAYLGLTWEWDFWEDYFAGFSLGASVHNGKKTSISLDKKELGCRVLFRESLTAGYRLTKNHSIMAFVDHISNGKLCSRNEGLETVGIRYGYRF